MALHDFDTLGYAKQLKAAGMPGQQADILMQAVVDSMRVSTSDLVTRDYLDATLEARFAQQDAWIDARFAQQDARIDARFAQQDARIDARFSRQDLRLNTLTVMATGIFAVTVLPALAKLFG